MDNQLDPTYRQFMDDMEAAGYEPVSYRGRNYYDGPAVRVGRDEFQDVIRATGVRLQSDYLSKSGLVVYPA